MGYVEEDQGPEHAEARGILEDMTQYLQEGKFEACLSLEGKVAELADSIASSAPGLAGKMFGNLSSAYAQLRQYDKAVAMTRRHLEIWESAKHLPEQQAVLREQITAYKEFDGRDLTYLMQRGCASRDWDAVIALRDRIEAYMVDPSCDRTWTCEIANNLGLVYLSVNNVPEAKTFLARALEIAESVGEATLIDSTKRNLARAESAGACAGGSS